MIKQVGSFLSRRENFKSMTLCLAKVAKPLDKYVFGQLQEKKTISLAFLLKKSPIDLQLHIIIWQVSTRSRVIVLM